jgi:hypothetical protein
MGDAAILRHIRDCLPTAADAESDADLLTRFAQTATTGPSRPSSGGTQAWSGASAVGPPGMAMMLRMTSRPPLGSRSCEAEPVPSPPPRIDATRKI